MNDLNAARIRTERDSIPLDDPSCVDGSVECVFKNLDRRLIEEISKHDYVYGCVAWLTHFDILDALASCKGVTLIVQKEDFLRPDAGGGPGKEVLRAKYGQLPHMYPRSLLGERLAAHLDVCGDPTTGPVRCCGIHEEKRASPRCHHKFVIFADVEGSGLRPVSVWTGSFNFTQNAVRSFENAVIISNPGIVRAYIEEFEQVLALSEPLNWAHEYVDPEYRIGT